MQGCDDIRNVCVFSGKVLLFILCLTTIDPPNHHGHLRAVNLRSLHSVHSVHRVYVVYVMYVVYVVYVLYVVYVDVDVRSA